VRGEGKKYFSVGDDFLRKRMGERPEEEKRRSAGQLTLVWQKGGKMRTETQKKIVNKRGITVFHARGGVRF